jgi:hypothetical protein
VKFSEFVRYAMLIVFAPRSTKTMEWRMLRLVNRDRKQHRLAPVAMQDDLRLVARKHSLDMAQKEFFDHVNLKGKSPSDRLKLSRITDIASGENLAKIGGHSNPTQVAETGLMNSPGHRANILNDRFNAVGVGVIRSEGGIYYFTQNFAHRDVLFEKKIPQAVRRKKGLHLRGKVFTDVKHIYVRVSYPGVPAPVAEVSHIVKDGSFSFIVPFRNSGVYEVSVFVDHAGGGVHTLANRFQLKVRGGFMS